MLSFKQPVANWEIGGGAGGSACCHRYAVGVSDAQWIVGCHSLSSPSDGRNDRNL